MSEAASAAQTSGQSSTATTGTETGADTTSGAATGGETTSGGAAADAPFYSSFPDDLKAAPAIVKYKSVEDLARGLVAAENRLGVPADQLVRLPKGLDDKEGIGAIMKALGTPETVDGYQFQMEGASDADLAMGKDFVAAMHEVGAPPFIVAAATAWWSKQNLATAEAATAASAAAEAAAETALKTEWGAAYKPKMDEIGRILNELGGKGLFEELNKSGMGNNVQLFKALGAVADKIAEPGALTGQGRGTGTTGVMTPAQAKVARAELEADPIKSVALRERDHSMHKAVVEERTRLIGLENPPKA
jgi:hypothetical protein